MSGVLVMNPDIRAEIADVLKKARANPLPWDAGQMIADGSATSFLELGDRVHNVAEIRRRYAPEHIVIGTYEIALSFEEQPAGLFKHLSLSSSSKGKVPGLEVLQMVLLEFGFSGWPLQRPNRIWMEEYKPGKHAVNVLELEPS